MIKKVLAIGFFIGCLSIHAQQVDINVPDDEFEEFLEGLTQASAGQTLNDNIVVFDSQADIDAVTQITAVNLGIVNLTGVEEFSNLTILEVQRNPITDFSPAFGLVNLEVVRCFDCDLEGDLDFSTMTNLREVGMDSNVSDNSGVKNGIDTILFDQTNNALEILDIRNNQLSSVQLPPDAPLQQLSLANNELTCGVDISSFVDTLLDFSVCQNPNLKFVYVDQTDLGTLNLSGNTCPFFGNNNDINGLLIDNSTTRFLAIQDEFVSIPDANFETLLITNGYDSLGLDDDQILRCDAETVLQLNLTNFAQSAPNAGFNSYDGVFVTTETNQAGNIQNLVGLDAFINIEVLYIQGNSGGGLQNGFTNLDLRSNIKLQQVFAFNNPNLQTVQFDGLVELKNFGLNNCDLSTLDLSNNVATTATFLDVNVGGNPNLSTINFGALSNISDANLSNCNFTEVDISNFQTSLVANPDPNNGQGDPSLRLEGNPGLTCILVSDVQDAIDQVTTEPTNPASANTNWIIPNGNGAADTNLFKIGACSTSPNDFVISVQTDNAGASGNTQFTVPTTGAGYNYNVSWGDGNTDTAVAGDITHTYAVAGTYTITISDNSGTGTGFPRIYFNNGGDGDKLLDIIQWGTGFWISMENAFSGCTNLGNITATDNPDLTNATDLTRMFFDASQFNGDISGWDVSTITNMTQMFTSANTFNANIGSWITSNVLDMSFMFFNATNFNGNISSWDVSQVTNMELMFDGADAFNQGIGIWNTGNVSNMRRMFQGNDGFNQDVSNWNTSNVTNMNAMFNGATVFDQSLASFNVSQVTDMQNMLDGSAVSLGNYDATLVAWALQPLQNGVDLGAGGLFYCDGETARQSIIDNFNWTFTGDARDAGCATCTAVRFADDNLRAFLVNDANNGNFLDQNGLPIDLDPTGTGNVCVEEATKVTNLNISGLAISSLMGDNIDPNNPISSAVSPDASNPNDPTNGLIAFSNLTELDISNNSFENGLQVPNVSLQRLIADNCIQGNVGSTWTADVNDSNFFLTNVSYFQFQDNFTLVSAFNVNFNGLNNVTEAVLSGTNLSGLEITASIWNQLELLTYENTNSLTSITGLQNANALRELRLNGSKYTGILDLGGLTSLETLQVDDNNVTAIDVGSSTGIITLTANRNINLTTVDLPISGANISSLFLDNNDITEIDISGVDSGLNGAGTVFSILNNSNLSCIRVSNVQDANDRTTASNYAIPNGDISVFTEQACSCTPVTINDNTLKNFLLTNTFEDVNGAFISIADNGEVCQELAETIVRLDVNGIGATDLTGLEVFSSLRYFDAYDNSGLSSLQPIEGLNQMIELRAFNCDVDGTLNFSAMPNLTIVGLDNNSIDGILFNSGNAVLEILDIKNNELAQLQLPTAPPLQRLILANNQLLGNLDIRPFTSSLEDFWVCGNQLTCIQINQTDFDNLSGRLSSSTCGNPPSSNDQVNGWLADDANLFKVNCDVLPVVSIIATDPSAAEEGTDEGVFTISLGEVNTSGTTLIINYTISGTAGTSDYQPINSTVTIPNNQSTATIFVVPIDDDEMEGTETVVVTLSMDVSYTLGNPIEATVTIADNDTGDNLDPGLPSAALTVEVLSDACPDSNPPTGQISISSNQTGFTFNVFFDQAASGTLSDGVLWEREELQPGAYEICLRLDDFPGWERCFNVEVRGLEAIALNGFKTLTSRQAVDFEVIGSNKYIVNVNGELFNFSSNNGTGAVTIQVPIINGVNNILISGESQCQGLISQKVIIGEALVFPNPISDVMNVIGLPMNGEVEYTLVDYSGRIIQRERMMISNNELNQDLSMLTSGSYIMLLKGVNWTKEFKIIKQ